ncbi:MAG: TIGR02444 family protein [Parahaliea sp.]
MDNALWQFSLSVYRKPAVESFCLHIQDRYNVEINYLLYGAWQASVGYCVDEAHIQALAKAMEPWRRDVVIPLRTLRYAWRQRLDVTDLRRQIKGIELEAEKRFQQQIWQFSQRVELPLGARLTTNLQAVLLAQGLVHHTAAMLADELAKQLV